MERLLPDRGSWCWGVVRGGPLAWAGPDSSSLLGEARQSGGRLHGSNSAWLSSGVIYMPCLDVAAIPVRDPRQGPE